MHSVKTIQYLWVNYYKVNGVITTKQMIMIKTSSKFSFSELWPEKKCYYYNIIIIYCGSMTHYHVVGARFDDSANESILILTTSRAAIARPASTMFLPITL